MTEPKLTGTAIVTGASGFIGSWVRDALLDMGVDVVAIRRPGSPPAPRGRSVEMEYSDVDALSRLVREEKPDYLFHVAGATKGVTLDDFRRGNVMPTQNLVRALTDNRPPGFRRLVLVSTLVAYGPSRDGEPVTESSEPRPVEFYGRSKLEAERVVQEAGDVLPWTIIRPAGVYGPRDADNFELFKLAARGLNVFYGNREKTFSCAHVDDVVDAIIGCADSEAALHKGYFICDGEIRTWVEFQRHIVDAAGRRVRDLDLPAFLTTVAAVFGELATRVDGKPRLFNRQKAIMGAQQSWTCRHDAARNDFGYAPRVEISDGIRRTFEWYRAEGWL
jgi:nucleoside-diphosphate-sugar epimerase